MRAPDVDLEELYKVNFPILADLAMAKNIPAEEAHDLAHEILLVSLLNLRKIDDITAWLKGAMVSALRHHKGAA